MSTVLPEKPPPTPPDPTATDTEDGSDHDPRNSVPFFPDFALLEAVTAFTFLVGLVLAASLTEPHLEPQADPNAAGYVPRPEWYFLWMFEMLKYFKGDLEIVGSVVIPGLLVGLLVAIPFLDRRRPRTRPILPGTRPVRVVPRVFGAGALGVLAGLTFMAVQSEPQVEEEGRGLTGVAAAGEVLYDKLGCASCHQIEEVGGDRGPELTTFARRPDAEARVLLHFAGFVLGDRSEMPAYHLTDEELRALAEFLLSLE